MPKSHASFVSGLLLLTVLLSTGCQTIAGRFNTPELPEKGKTHTEKNELLNKYQLFINAAIEAQQNATDKTKLRHYFESGVTLSNAISDNWFAMHFKAARETSHTKTLGNIIGATTIGVLGFTGAEAKQLGIFGLAMAGMNAEFENYMAYYLLSPAIPQIKKKLDEGRQSYADGIRQSFVQDTEFSFPVVQSALEGYHGLSSRIEIQRIVTESVELAQYKVPDEKAEQKKVQISSGSMGLHELLNAGKPGTLSPDEVLALYVADKHLSLTAEEQGKVKAKYDARYGANPLYKTWIDRLSTLRGKADAKKDNDRLSTLLAETGPLVGGPTAWGDLVGADKAALIARTPEQGATPASSMGAAVGIKPQVTSGK